MSDTPEIVETGKNFWEKFKAGYNSRGQPQLADKGKELADNAAKTLGAKAEAASGTGSKVYKALVTDAPNVDPDSGFAKIMGWLTGAGQPDPKAGAGAAIDTAKDKAQRTAQKMAMGAYLGDVEKQDPSKVPVETRTPVPVADILAKAPAVPETPVAPVTAPVIAVEPAVSSPVATSAGEIIQSPLPKETGVHVGASFAAVSTVSDSAPAAGAPQHQKLTGAFTQANASVYERARQMLEHNGVAPGAAITDLAGQSQVVERKPAAQVVKGDEAEIQRYARLELPMP